MAVFSEYMAAVFLETYLSGSLFDKCKKGSAADFLTRPGGRTDLYHFLGIGGSATIFLTGGLMGIQRFFCLDIVDDSDLYQFTLPTQKTGGVHNH